MTTDQAQKEYQEFRNQVQKELDEKIQEVKDIDDLNVSDSIKEKLLNSLNNTKECLFSK